MRVSRLIVAIEDFLFDAGETAVDVLQVNVDELLQLEERLVLQGVVAFEPNDVGKSGDEGKTGAEVVRDHGSYS
jgi:hypothetical protein